MSVIDRIKQMRSTTRDSANNLDQKREHTIQAIQKHQSMGQEEKLNGDSQYSSLILGDDTN
jgi:hypothetical protein